MGAVEEQTFVPPPLFDCGRCEQVYWHKQERKKTSFSFHPMQFIVCPLCGNKRCPMATDHRLTCTRSNAPNQPGSDHYFLDSWPEVVE